MSYIYIERGVHGPSDLPTVEVLGLLVVVCSGKPRGVLRDLYYRDYRDGDMEYGKDT